MNRQTYLTRAEAAVERAASLARDAEKYARSEDYRSKAVPYAAAGALWADMTRSHAAIAQAMPATDDTIPED
ncbi:hypothetical protein [Streptomyces sp. NBC_00996]|uniref:hypothetical protein n=1 Tax=Streptomyces sp. NBC_00996 TaxID=2903710 RepID=UPI00386BA1E6|nr:hypothetical protein OG390_15490 [Streptomyces sp. NBC_00996]